MIDKYLPLSIHCNNISCLAYYALFPPAFVVGLSLIAFLAISP
jgi:hypothetical protein